MLLRRLTIFGLCWHLFASAVPLPAQGADFLILSPRDLLGAANELARHRREEGLGVRVEQVDALARGGRIDPEVLKARIAELREEEGPQLRYVLLMGDAPAPGDERGLLRIPPRILKAEFADERWPHPKEIASDPWYGMLDDDLVPELEVGRLPADDLRGARAMVARIIAYEQSTDFGSWRKRLEIVAGTAGFGALADSLLESTFKRYVAKFIDPAYDVTVTWSNPKSPYCYLPSRFSEKVVERFNAGSLVAAFVGHGSAHAFGSIRWNGRRYPTFRLEEARRVALEQGAPVLVILACSTGWFDHARGDCISEVLLAQPRGPVAVFASTRISQPYADAIVGRELIANLMAPVHQRMGDAIRAVRMALANPSGADQKLIDSLASLIMKPGTLKPCREDHIHLYCLFGDPCMRLGYAQGAAKLQAPQSAAFGEEIEVSGALDRDYEGKAVLTLERRRGEMPKELASTAGLDGDALEKAMALNWQRANDLVLARTEIQVEGKSFTARIAVPAEGLSAGEHILKLFLSDGHGCALGSRSIELREP